MPSRRVLRWEVPVDDDWHRLAVDAQHLVHVGCRRADVIEFWTTGPVIERGVSDGLGRAVEPTKYETAATTPAAWEFRVFGTGHPVDGRYLGTAVAPGGQLVWHLFGRRMPDA